LDVSLVHERFAFDPRVIPQLRSVIAEKKPDIIQSMNFKSHFLVRLLGLGRARKWVAFHHGYTWTDLKNSAYNQLDRWSLRGADAVVTVCIPFARELESLGVEKDRLTVQHNSIRPFVPSPEGEVKELEMKLGLKPGDFTLISVGRLSREKGHADLIEAMAPVRASAKRPVRLVIVGDGPERAALQAKVAALKLEQSVTFAGFQSEVTPYYQIADIAVLPSHSEGSPYALLEAMAAGVPALATSVGGVPEIAKDNETGFLVERENPDRLATRILELMEDQAARQRVSRAARERVDEYRPETYRTNLTQLYLRVLAES
jgi:glycosyltransferase involved in cell wall biosynthesis